MNKKLVLEKTILSFLVFCVFYTLAFYTFNIVDDAFINTIKEIGSSNLSNKQLADYKLYVYGALAVFVTVILVISVWGVFSIMKRKTSLFDRGNKDA